MKSDSETGRNDVSITGGFSAFRLLIQRERLLVSVLLFVLLVRIVFVLLACSDSGNPSIDTFFKKITPRYSSSMCNGKLRGDAYIYNHLAWTFAQKGRLDIEDLGLQSVVAPGFPVFMGGIFKIFGRSVKAMLFAYALLDTLTALVVVFLLRKTGLTYRPVVEWGFIVCFALYIPYLTSVIVPLTEGLFTFLMAVVLWLVLQGETDGKWKSMVCAGFVLGMAVLTRPLVLLFPIWLAGIRVLLWPGSGRRQTVVRYAIMFLGMLIVCTPWTVRNYLKYDRLVIISSDKKPLVLGSGLLKSTNESMSSEERNREVYRQTAGRSIPAVACSALLQMIRHPWRSLYMWGKKLINLWLNVGFDTKPSMGSVVTAIVQGLLILIACFGAWRGKGVNHSLWLPWAFFGYTTFFHVLLFTAKIRFIVPVMPWIILLAVIGGSRLLPEGTRLKSDP